MTKRGRPLIDLTGQTFGNWTVLSYSGKRKWLCQCACGHQAEVLGAALRLGRSAQCRYCGRGYLSPNERPWGASLVSEAKRWCSGGWGRQRQLAQALGSPLDTVKGWFAGRRMPSAKQAQALLEFLKKYRSKRE